MKSSILSLFILLYVSPSFAQESNPTDEELTSTVVGTWQHVSSTDSNGDQIRYERKIELFADGSGICTKTVDGESIKIPFYWDVENGAIMLYIVNKRGKRINTDSQLIWDVDEHSLNLACTWDSAEYGITSLYKRMTQKEVSF